MKYFLKVVANLEAFLLFVAAIWESWKTGVRGDVLAATALALSSLFLFRVITIGLDSADLRAVLGLSSTRTRVLDKLSRGVVDIAWIMIIVICIALYLFATIGHPRFQVHSADYRLFDITLIILATWCVIELIEEDDTKQLIRDSTAVVQSMRGSVVVESDRTRMYDIAKETIRQCPNATRCYATSFELVPFDYFSDATQAGSQFMVEWDRRLRAGEITHQQICLIASEKELHEVEDRLRRYKDVEGYQIAVIVGPPSSVFFDLLQVGDRFASIGLPTNANNPYHIDSSFLLGDREAIKLGENFFMAQWHRATLLKSLGSGSAVVDVAKLEAIRQSIAGCKTHTDAVALIDTATRNLPHLQRVVPVLELLQTLETGPASALSGLAAKEIQHVHETLAELLSGSVRIKGNVHELLGDFLLQANSYLRCTSLLPEDEEFWLGLKGRAYLAAQGQKTDGSALNIERVFVIDALSETAKSIMLDQLRHGVNVWWVKRSKLNRQDIMDFALSDGKTVFVDESGDVRVTVKRNEVDAFGKLFSRVQRMARKYKKEEVHEQDHQSNL